MMVYMDKSMLDWERINTLIDMALEEDLGGVGDATSLSVIPRDLQASATLLTREACVIAGLPVAEAVFKAVNKDIEFIYKLNDTDHCEKGAILAEINGPAANLLTAERTALNFLQRLCGVATVSAKYAAAVENSATIILDTRKTTPGWRNLEKYAVAAGGATNHRIGLFDRVMIKDNHRELAELEGAGGIARSVAKARNAYPHLEIEVEADTLDEVREAVATGAEYILLDNMTNAEMAEAVAINAGRSKLEASGGITLERISSISKIGVDFISVGALTHSVKAIDISLDIIRRS
jgi:nicotinate-nucleotide pyrophosphorylase (carboxylating)